MADSTETEAETTTETEPTESLGDGGKKALDAERVARRTAEKTAKQHEVELAKARAELDEVRSGQLSEQEKAIEAARKEAHDAAKAETSSQYQRRLDAGDVKVAAATKFANPDKAILFVDLEGIPRDADGNIEPKALDAALAKVLKEEPYLAKSGGAGSADGGARGGGTPDQLTRSDLTGMKPEEINKARLDGRLANLMGA